MDIQDHLANTTLPDLVIPLGAVTKWIHYRDHLTDNPFDGRWITAPMRANLELYDDMERETARLIQSKEDRIQQIIPNNTTEAQFRKIAYKIEQLEEVIRQWQFWHKMRLCVGHGWMPSPLFKIRTMTQGDKLADGTTFQWERHFRSAGITSKREWKTLQEQVRRLQIYDVAIDAGTVPPPYQGQPTNNVEIIRCYQYRAGRISAEGTRTERGKKPLSKVGRDFSVSSVMPHKASDSPVSSADAEPTDGTDDDMTISTDFVGRVKEEFPGIVVTGLQEWAERCWENGFPHPIRPMGTHVENDCGVHWYQRQQDDVLEHYVFETHSGSLYMTQGPEGQALYDMIHEYWADEGKIEAAIPTLWEQIERTPQDVGDAELRHERLAQLLERGFQAGMYQLADLYEDMQEGMGPPPDEDTINALERRVVAAEGDSSDEAPDKADKAPAPSDRKKRGNYDTMVRQWERDALDAMSASEQEAFFAEKIEQVEASRATTQRMLDEKHLDSVQ